MQKQHEVGQIIDVKGLLVQFSNEAHREEKEGTLYVVVDKDSFGRSDVTDGQVVKLVDNDGSNCPSFQLTPTTTGRYANWKGLARLPEVKGSKPVKPSVASTRTVYSDGVEVSEEEVKFDGKTFKREELKTLVKRYQEVLRRPVATVHVPAKKTVPKVTKKVSKK